MGPPALLHTFRSAQIGFNLERCRGTSSEGKSYQNVKIPPAASIPSPYSPCHDASLFGTRIWCKRGATVQLRNLKHELLRKGIVPPPKGHQGYRLWPFHLDGRDSFNRRRTSHRAQGVRKIHTARHYMIRRLCELNGGGIENCHRQTKPCE